jgi:3D-(3,5/4)-trihydroxycyclohexane-1,2-dione acylhydrolase (decyclizing)
MVTAACTAHANPFAWTPGDADWDVGVPEVSSREAVRTARKQQEDIRAKQRVGV